MTAEDPVDSTCRGSTRCTMKEANRLNFAAALRSFLRQDPNIILVADIRDFETAEIAIKAAADRTPRAVDAAHQRRALDHFAVDEHGIEPIPGGTSST